MNIRNILTACFFIFGLIFFSLIKNETRNIQKDINALKLSIDDIKINLHEAILDNDVITSPENISKLAYNYLDTDFVFYKRSQIQFYDNNKILETTNLTTKNSVLKKTNKLINFTSNNKKKISFQISKKLSD